jgi:hypothetical protein
MFKSLEEMIQIRFKPTRWQLLRDALVRWTLGIAGAVAGFQAVFSMILALE